mgnify:CR=1 FL=1
MKPSLTLLAALLIGSPFLGVVNLSHPADAAPMGSSRIRQARAFTQPVHNKGVAVGPPIGAQVTTAIHFNPSLRWKTNPSTRTVFAIDADRRVWFIDPTSGWPYTLDSRGVAYTANARSGIVYSLGNLAQWPGTIPYFFENWALVGGLYTIAAFDRYLAIYTNPGFGLVDYSETYATIWQYEPYFESSAFSAERINLELGPGGYGLNPGSDAVINHADSSHDFGPATNFGAGADFGAGGDFGVGGDFGGGGGGE